MPTLGESYQAIMDPGTSLETIASAFPREWSLVQDATAAIVKQDRSDLVSEHLVKAQTTISDWNRKLKASTRPHTLLPQAVPQMATARLTLFALESLYRRALARQDGRAPTFFDRLISQTLFFDRKRQRRSPSRLLFKCLWPLVRGKAAISTTIQGMGIYCVFTREFARELKRLICDRACVEVGAGDGTLTLLLEAFGVSVHATDNYSWEKRIRYPDWVEKYTAEQALERYAPEVVLCSWPPPGNQFEKHIFATESVKMYIAIVSRHRYAAGNWLTYRSQKGFAWQSEPELTRLLVPQEWDHEVLVFRREG
jgi:hypothetical protein